MRRFSISVFIPIFCFWAYPFNPAAARRTAALQLVEQIACVADPLASVLYVGVDHAATNRVTLGQVPLAKSELDLGSPQGLSFEIDPRTAAE